MAVEAPFYRGGSGQAPELLKLPIKGGFYAPTESFVPLLVAYAYDTTSSIWFK